MPGRTRHDLRDRAGGRLLMTAYVRAGGRVELYGADCLSPDDPADRVELERAAAWVNGFHPTFANDRCYEMVKLLLARPA